MRPACGLLALLLAGCAHPLTVHIEASATLNADDRQTASVTRVGVWPLSGSPEGLAHAPCDAFSSADAVADLVAPVATLDRPGAETVEPGAELDIRLGRVPASTRWVLVTPYYLNRCDLPDREVALWGMARVGWLRRDVWVELDGRTLAFPWSRPERQRGCVEGGRPQHLRGPLCDALGERVP